MARAHLAAGHDVVVPQFLSRPQFIADVEAAAQVVLCPEGAQDQVYRELLDRLAGKTGTYEI